MTNIAVVLSKILAAFLILTELGALLDLEAMHAHHLFDRIPINLVRLLCIVTKPAGVEALAARCSDLSLAWVVRTTQNALFFIL